MNLQKETANYSDPEQVPMGVINLWFYKEGRVSFTYDNYLLYLNSVSTKVKMDVLSI